MDKITIVIRTSDNPLQFRRCINSIEKQTYSNIVKLIIVDNERSINYSYKDKKEGDTILFLNGENIRDKYRNEKVPIGYRKLTHNLYFNYIHKYITDGWIFVLDSDDVLMNEYVIENLMKLVNNIDTQYFFNMKWFNDTLMPGKMNKDCKPIMNTIGSPCQLFHSKYIGDWIWDHYSAADYRSMMRLYKVIPKHKFLNITVAKIFRMGKGKKDDKI